MLVLFDSATSRGLFFGCFVLDMCHIVATQLHCFVSITVLCVMWKCNITLLIIPSLTTPKSFTEFLVDHKQFEYSVLEPVLDGILIHSTFEGNRFKLCV